MAIAPAAKKNTDKNTNKNTTPDTKKISAKTGDDASNMVWMMLLLISGIGSFIIIK